MAVFAVMNGEEIKSVCMKSIKLGVKRDTAVPLRN